MHAITHVVTDPLPPFCTTDGRLEIHQVPSWKDNLIWLIHCQETGEVGAVDGPECETTLAYCEKNGLHLTTILNTHTHADHVGINRDLARRGLLTQMQVVGYDQVAEAVPGITLRCHEGDEIPFGTSKGKVMLTEGHINGHISYLFDDVLFCGDTLFTGGCGYLFDGPPSKMLRSLELLGKLPWETRVCCGHEYTQDNLRFAWSVEPDNEALAQRIRDVWSLRTKGQSAVPSTIGMEKTTNPFMRHHSESLQRRVAQAMPDAALDSPVAIFAATRELKNRKEYLAITDSELPL